VAKEYKTVKVNKTRRVVSTKIKGVDVDTTRFRYNQAPDETPNGVITVFTIPNSEEYVSGMLEVFLDGIQQVKDTDWEETTSSTYTFINSKVPATGEKVRNNYIKQ